MPVSAPALPRDASRPPARQPIGKLTGVLGETPLPRVVSVAHVLFALQWLALVFVSVRLFDHYHLGRDFSVYSQAWWLIAHGHLNPFSSPSGLSFVKNHFELIMWVLAPLYWVN